MTRGQGAPPKGPRPIQSTRAQSTTFTNARNGQFTNMAGANGEGPSGGIVPALTFHIDPRDIAPLIGHGPKNIRRPEEIAEFSYDEDRNIHLDARSLAYYYPPPDDPDSPPFLYLDRGLESFRKTDDSVDEHLVGLLAAIMEMEKKQNAKIDTHFISYRGMMTNLLTMGFSRLDEWVMSATFFDGTVFIEEDKSAKAAAKERQRSRDKGPDMSYFYGFKFETLFTIPDTWDNVTREEIENRDDKPVSNFAQYCSIVKTGVGNMGIVVGGEVDSVWDDKVEGRKNQNYVELKTRVCNNFSHQSDKDKENYERKQMKYWAQSYLIGCPKIIVGRRSRDGRLMLPVEQLTTMNIPTDVRNSTHIWDSVLCVQTLNAFLEWLYNQLKDTSGVWQLAKRRNEMIVHLIRRTAEGTEQILTDEFKQHRCELARARLSEAVDKCPTYNE